MPAAVAASDLPRAGTERHEVLGKTMWVVRLVRRLAGSVARLAWAKANGCRWDEVTSMLVAWGGRPEVLQWAREHDCPWDSRACSGAAQNGHLEVLQWAREHDCPWIELTCQFAALEGHLEVLQWAREHGQGLALVHLSAQRKLFLWDTLSTFSRYMGHNSSQTGHDTVH